MKEFFQNNINKVAQDQHERIIGYFQSRLNDLREKNLNLLGNSSKLINKETSNFENGSYNRFHFTNNQIENFSKNSLMSDDNYLFFSMNFSDNSSSEILESRNEALHEKMKELQYIQNKIEVAQRKLSF